MNSITTQQDLGKLYVTKCVESGKNSVCADIDEIGLSKRTVFVGVCPSEFSVDSVSGKTTLEKFFIIYTDLE